MANEVDVLAVMDAMTLSAERLAAGEPVTSCAATVEVAKRTRAAVVELMAEFDKAASALQAIAALGFDSTDKEVSDEALRIARLWRSDDGHDAPLRNARAALARVQGDQNG